MAAYLKLFVDSLDRYQKLSDGEFGRLVRAALQYKADGTEPYNLGRESLLWDGMKLDIDRDNEAYQNLTKVRSEAGKLGGRPKKADVNTEKQKKQKVFLESKKSQDKDKEEDKDKTSSSGAVEFYEKNFGPPSQYIKSRIVERSAEIGQDRVIIALQEAAKSNAKNPWRYAQAVLDRSGIGGERGFEGYRDLIADHPDRTPIFKKRGE